jgi:hypothetical protein
MDSDKKELIERIQSHIEGATVQDAEIIEVIEDRNPSVVAATCKADRLYTIFRYQIDGIWLRGAFTNGDPAWEEDDYESFAKLIGEDA